jgi:hypothetical protein
LPVLDRRITRLWSEIVEEKGGGERWIWWKSVGGIELKMRDLEI